MSKIISIEGNIGSGKSTLLRELNTYFKDNNDIIFLEEPVSHWENIKDCEGNTILKKFYEDQKKYSFAFQMMAYISRLSILKDAIKNHPNAIIITERCLNTDRYVFAKMLYDSGLLEDVEYQIYTNWFDHFNDIANIQKIVYLKTDPTICAYRINKRNRLGESSISIDYLTKCHEYHEDMVNKMIDNSLIINADFDCGDDNNLRHIWIQDIEKFIKL
jgi:deoxyadenosine/deoxycytidine kinase